MEERLRLLEKAAMQGATPPPQVEPDEAAEASVLKPEVEIPDTGLLLSTTVCMCRVSCFLLLVVRLSL